MSKARWMQFLGIACLLLLPASAMASEACPGATTASSEASFLAMLQSPAGLTEAAPALGDQPMDGALAQQTTYCTKETCAAARAECREWCPFPCAMTFRCVAPWCGECISCSC